MKVKDLVKQLYEAIFSKDKAREAEIYHKLLKKSLKHKHTETVR
jgi:hypothetical protein